jgi:hypothetical protein
MLRIGVILLLIVSFQITTLAQQKKVIQSFERFAVSVGVGSAPLPGGNATIIPGFEFYFSPHFSFLNELSLQLEKNDNEDSLAFNKKFLRYKGELRYYFEEDVRRVTAYFGLQFAAGKRNFDIKKRYWYYERPSTDSVFYFDQATVNSPYQTITFQIGMVGRLFDQLSLDINGGYGFRFVNTSYPTTVNLTKDVLPRSLFGSIKPFSSYRYIGRTRQSQFNLAFRLLYRF